MSNPQPASVAYSPQNVVSLATAKECYVLLRVVRKIAKEKDKCEKQASLRYFEKKATSTDGFSRFIGHISSYFHVL